MNRFLILISVGTVVGLVGCTPSEGASPTGPPKQAAISSAAFQWSSTQGRAKTPEYSYAATGISCPDSNTCVASGFRWKGQDTLTSDLETDGLWAQNALDFRPVVWSIEGGLHAQITEVDLKAKDEVLSGISCPAVGTCLAVGSRHTKNGNTTTTWRFSAGSWSQEAPSAPAEIDPLSWPFLTNVSCSDGEHCIAVGGLTGPTAPSSRSFATHPLVLVLDQAAWLQVSNPIGAGLATIRGIDCHLSLRCFIAGSGIAANANPGPQAGAGGFSGYADGASWASTSEGDTASWQSTACVDLHRCLDVGEVRRWPSMQAHPAAQWIGSNGGAQSVLEGPGSEQWLASASCPTSELCIAAGAGRDLGPGFGQPHPLIEEFQGGNALLSIPKRKLSRWGAELSSVSCPSATRCVAAGTTQPGSASTKASRALFIFGIAR